MMHEIKLVKTADGSYTIYVPELNEHYHSVHGAINESEHVFIRSGLHNVIEIKKEISILEVGYGTGLNAFLTCIEAQKKNLKINYTAIELFPVSPEISETLNYPALIDNNAYHEIYEKIIHCEWGKLQAICENFSIIKIQADVTSFTFPENAYDLIYFDAFSPDVQPEMWTQDIFSSLLTSMKNHSTFVTYSTKGNVKRALKSCGFSIEKLPGPVGKREILRAFN